MPGKGEERKQLRGWAGGLTEHLNVPFGDGIEAAAGEQDNVGLGGFGHGAASPSRWSRGCLSFCVSICLQREKGRRGSAVDAVDSKEPLQTQTASLPASP